MKDQGGIQEQERMGLGPGPDGPRVDGQAGQVNSETKLNSTPRIARSEGPDALSPLLTY